MQATIKSVKGGLTAAKGFMAGGIKAGIKASGKNDLALLYSTTKCSAAGTFTTNRIRASSVDWCEKLLPSSDIQVIVCNSGCANACTGDRGRSDTELFASLAAKGFGCAPKSALVASTGVIGHFLPQLLPPVVIHCCFCRVVISKEEFSKVLQRHLFI